MSALLHPEYRRDPVTSRWVIIAPERSRRPLALSHSKPHSRRDAERDTCPFCEGREDETPDELYAVRPAGTRPGERGWQLRVVPNKFPAVRVLDGVPFASAGDLFETFPGFGRHEVVIECPHHESNPTGLTDAAFRDVLIAYRERLADLNRDRRFAYVTVFKNVGAESGASLAHLHSQLVATPVVPDQVREELAGADEYYKRDRRCVFCDVIRQELDAGTRVVGDTPHFLAITPFASRFGYEMWVLPKAHGSWYEVLTDDQAGELAVLLKRLLGKLDAVLAHPAYNYFLHTGPARANDLPYYHWHLEIVPRTARAAGFEFGSGCFINAVAPEAAAADLRAAEPPPCDHTFGTL